jgi:hypothetical protein
MKERSSVVFRMSATRATPAFHKSKFVGWTRPFAVNSSVQLQTFRWTVQAI